MRKPILIIISLCLLLPASYSRRMDALPKEQEAPDIQETSSAPTTQPQLLVFCGMETYFDGDAVKPSTKELLQLLHAAFAAPNSNSIRNRKYTTLANPRAIKDQSVQILDSETLPEAPKETTQKKSTNQQIPKSSAAAGKTVSRGRTPSTSNVTPKFEDKNDSNLEKALFPMKYLHVTQGVGGSYSHLGTNALDLAGADSGCDIVYAPFTGIVRRIYTFSGNFVWLESVDKIIFADGSVDYMTIMVGHNDDVSNLYVGQIIPQGTAFYQEGKAGIATGNHIHLECARGKFSGNGWHQNTHGNWLINNSILPYRALFLQNNTIIINSGGYQWQQS